MFIKIHTCFGSTWRSTLLVIRLHRSSYFSSTLVIIPLAKYLKSTELPNHVGMLCHRCVELLIFLAFRAARQCWTLRGAPGMVTSRHEQPHSFYFSLLYKYYFLFVPPSKRSWRAPECNLSHNTYFSFVVYNICKRNSFNKHILSSSKC